MATNMREIVDEKLAEIGDLAGKAVHFETTEGLIRLTLWPDVAPGHVANIVGLTAAGFYDGIIFHRVIPGFMLQVGCPDGQGTGGPGYTIDAEFNDTDHVRGVLSMARTSDPNSAGSQFFICHDHAPHLNNQYTAFGTCADDEESLATVDAIANIPTGGADRPTKEVKILKASVV